MKYINLLICYFSILYVYFHVVFIYYLFTKFNSNIKILIKLTQFLFILLFKIIY